MAFKKINVSELSFNPFEKIGKQWMLLTGGDSQKFNTMTASWGQMGVLWNKNVLTCYIRPNRYTYDFVENNECFTVSFLGEEFRKALLYCGSHSGRDYDKAKETGLTPLEIDGCMTFEQAEMVFVCRKLYSYDMHNENFLTNDGFDDKFYGKEPYHRAYISEIVAVYSKE